MRFLTLIRSLRLSEYTLLGCLMVMVLFGAVVFRNLDAIMWFYRTTGSVFETAYFVLTLYGGLMTLFSPLGTIVVLLFAFLFSFNLILLFKYIRLRRVSGTQFKSSGAASSLGGTVAAVLGIGCASCGTAILFSLLSTFGASGLILWLPLHGEEFSLIGLAGLGYGTWYLLDKLATPLVCET